MSNPIRDARLQEMSANLKIYAAKEKLRLTEEAAWLKKLQVAHGDSVQAEIARRVKLGVVNSISELLK